MGYNRLNLTNGIKLDESHFVHIENGIWNNDNKINDLQGRIVLNEVNITSIRNEFDDMWEVLRPIEMSTEEVAYLFALKLKETISSYDANYLATMAYLGFPLKVFLMPEDDISSGIDILKFYADQLEYVPIIDEDGFTYNMLKICFSCKLDGITLHVILQEHLADDYTIEFLYDVTANNENIQVDIDMVTYASLFTMGNTLTVDDIGEEIFGRLNIAIANNTPFYLNKWKTLSETEQYMNSLKFELNAVKTDENKNPIYYDFINTVMITNDEGKLVVGAHTLRYDVINQTLTGGTITNN